MFTTRDLKAGDIIMLDGTRCRVISGRGGISRVVEPLEGPDEGWKRSAYVFRATYVIRDGVRHPVELHPSDRKRAETIRAMA